MSTDTKAGWTSAKCAGVLATGLLLATAGCSPDASPATDEMPTATNFAQSSREAPEPIVKRVGHCPEYYGALLRLPDEPLFWHGVRPCATHTKVSGDT